MAFLFVDSLAQNNSRFVQISCKILELLLLSVGLFSTLVVMKEAVVPYSCRIVFSSLMGFWTSIKCFLSSPLTIIITINLMVLLIFVSSAIHRRRDAHNHHHPQITLPHPDHDDHLDHDVQITHHESPPPPPPPPAPAPPQWDIVEVTPPPPPPPPQPPSDAVQVETAPSSRKATIPIRSNTTRPSTSLQSLFSNHDLAPPPPAPSPPPPLEKWKDVFIENEEEETMDSTWEAITGGGNKQKGKKKKNLKKSETWDAPPPPPPRPRRLDSEEVLPTSPKWKELRKAETFNDAVSLTRRGGLIRRDPSMSLEEFNHKVDTFIKNFNDSMRLQRQQSKQNKFFGIINQKRF